MERQWSPHVVRALFEIFTAFTLITILIMSALSISGHINNQTPKCTDIIRYANGSTVCEINIPASQVSQYQKAQQ